MQIDHPMRLVARIHERITVACKSGRREGDKPRCA